MRAPLTSIQFMKILRESSGARSDGEWTAFLESRLMSAHATASMVRDSVERLDDGAFSAHGHAYCHGAVTGWLAGLEIMALGESRMFRAQPIIGTNAHSEIGRGMATSYKQRERSGNDPLKDPTA